MGLSLLLVKPKFYCKQETTGNFQLCVEDEYCAITNDADRYINLEDSRTTMTSDFELYCGRHYIIGLLGSLLFLGTYLAGFFFPYLANWKGRKLAIYISVALGGVSMVVIGAAHRIEIVIVSIVLVGIAFGGFEIIAIVYTAELSGNSFRIKSNTIFNIAWSVTQFFTTSLFLLARTWRIICIVLIGAPLLISLYVIKNYIFETPRYLYFEQRYQEAREVLNKISKINRRVPIKERLLGEHGQEAEEGTIFFPKRQVPPEVQAIAKGNFTGYLDLFKDKNIRKITLFLLYVWFFRHFAYYGLNFSLPSLGAEVYRNFTIASVAEFAAFLAADRINQRFGRKLSLIISVGLVSLACLAIIFFPIPDECYLAVEGCYQKRVSLVSTILAKFGLSFFASVLITYTSESYPTEVRPLGLGITMSTGRLGAIAMPFIVAYMSNTQVNPLFSFGVAGVIALIFIYFLPETYGRILKDYVEEMKPHTQPLIRISETSNKMESSFD